VPKIQWIRNPDAAAVVDGGNITTATPREDSTTTTKPPEQLDLQRKNESAKYDQAGSRLMRRANERRCLL
jgi:hypothetical protein